MRVLITHPTLRRRGGVQTFSLQLARELASLGHEVRGFSGLPESDNEPSLAELPEAGSPSEFAPDIIHAQHQLPALAALLAFPGVPAVFHCHGGTWRDLPFRHPRIHHYLAMSRSLAERIKTESYLRDDEVSLYLNSVDMRRFRPHRPLPMSLDKVLVYHGRMSRDDPAASAISEATARMGIRVDFAGKGFGLVVEEPADLLPAYPLVFASGISAIEAMACGCAVVMLVPGACGPMVGGGNFDHLRAHNFSIPANSAPATPESVTQALASYDAVNATMVADRIRAEADSSSSVRQLLDIYERVLTRQVRMPCDPREESLAVSMVLRGLTPMVHTSGLASGDPAADGKGGIP